MAVEKIFILPGGFLDIDRSIFLSNVDMGHVIKAPVYSVLLMDTEGPILIDVGLNPDGVKDPEKAWGPRARLIKPQLNEEDDVRLRLKEVGLSVSDIKMVDTDPPALGPYRCLALFLALSHCRPT